jgi:hypothetical protein
MNSTHLQLLFLRQSNGLLNLMLKEMIRKPVFVLCVFVLMASCRHKAAQPTYLEVNPFIVSSNVLTEGTALQNITEAVIYIDDLNAGVYTLPARIPLALGGSHKITIGPLIVENAIASNPRFPYTFLTAFDTTATLSPSGTLKLTPRIKYRTDVKFEMIEDFENPVPLFSKTIANTLDTLIRDSIPGNNIEPGHCATFSIPNGIIMEYASRNEYSLPSSSTSNTFVEIHYKTDLPLAIGLFINEPTIIEKTGVVTLNPKAGWSKAYINLTTVVSTRPQGTKFRLFFASLNTSGDTKAVFIDNIKILHFE